jgi:arsenate reductase
MSEITIFHNRARSTACKVPAMIRHGGAGPRVVHCLETLPGRARSIELLAGLGIAVRERLRRKRTPCDALKLDDPAWTDDRLLGFITAHPILMNRPPRLRPCRPVAGGSGGIHLGDAQGGDSPGRAQRRGPAER